MEVWILEIICMKLQGQGDTLIGETTRMVFEEALRTGREFYDMA